MTKYTVLSPDDPYSKAVEILLDSQQQEFLVAEGHVVHGILTRRDLINGLHDHGNDARVSTAMQTDFLTFTPEMQLKEAFQQLMASNCSVAPVMDDSEVIGIIDKENINELLMVQQALKK